MIDLYFPFSVQTHQLQEISDGFVERENMPDNLIIGNFEEFLKDTRLDEQLNDVPDTIWTNLPSVNPYSTPVEDCKNVRERILTNLYNVNAAILCSTTG